MTANMKRIGLTAVLILLSGCGNASDQQHAEAPATVSHAVEEVALATVTLTPQAETRLGIETALVEERSAPRTRKLGGVLMAVPGSQVTVTAPVAGTVLQPESGLMPRAGTAARADQVLCRLLPSQADRDRLGTREELTLRQMQYDLARTQAERTAQMLRDGSASARQYQEARAESSRAAMALTTVQAQLGLLEGRTGLSGSEVPSALGIRSPLAGIVQQILTTPGQTVTAGAPLFEVTDVDPIWIRVPVYAGDLAGIDREQGALVMGLADLTGAGSRRARAVTAPMTADPASATADLFFELRNADAAFRPGERVSATLYLEEEAEQSVIPYSAVLYDMHGGTWVYANPAEHDYVRTRIELAYVVGEMAVLAHGPPLGTRVVITGAAELFGTEFGAGK